MPAAGGEAGFHPAWTTPITQRQRRVGWRSRCSARADGQQLGLAPAVIGATRLWVCAAPCSGVIRGVSRVSQAPGHPMARKVVGGVMHMLGSKTAMTGTQICPLNSAGSRTLCPTPLAPSAHRHTCPASTGKRWQGQGGLPALCSQETRCLGTVSKTILPTRLFSCQAF